MCFCVFVFFYEKHKNTLTNFFCLSFSAIELQQRTNVFFVFMCFFLYRKHKNTKTKNWFVFLDTLASLRQKTKIVKQIFKEQVDCTRTNANLFQ